MNRIKAGRITSYTTRQGLFSDEVKVRALEDDLGYLWMSCRRGLFRVNRTQFDTLDKDRMAWINPYHLRAGGWVGDGTVQRRRQTSGLEKSRRPALVSSIRGVVAVEPDVNSNEQPPAVVIEEIRFDQHLLRQRSWSRQQRYSDGVMGADGLRSITQP